MSTIDRCVKLTAALLMASLVGCDEPDRLEREQAPPHAQPLPAELPARPPSTIILEPRTGAPISSPVITVSGAITPPPQHLEAFVVIRDQFNWFVQWPPVRIDQRTGAFSHRNVCITSPGEWELHVVMATPPAARLFHERASRGDWGGMTALPAGTASAASVSVRRLDPTP